MEDFRMRDFNWC